jgi:glycosyltransferase involved in cell wall biosynthesis
MTSILHIRNIANVGAVLASGQRTAGHKSVCVQIISKSAEFEADVNLNLAANYYIWSLPKRLQKIKSGLSPYIDSDILHLHDGGLYPYDMDVPSLKKKSKVVVHWHGSKLRKKGQRLSKCALKIFVSTPDLLELAPGSTWIPNPIDLSKYSPNIKREDEKSPIRILHAPTNRKIKGTDSIISTINKLKKEGCEINFQLLENTRHQNVKKAMQECDIVIDWINPDYGIYGMVSIEGMAFGKPVLCSLNEDYLSKYYHNCPIVNTNEKNLKEEISLLYGDSGLRKSVGQSGRRYVEKAHDLSKVVQLVEKHYKELI